MELTTKLTRLDLKTIKENCTNKEFWKKKWTIYKSDNIEITFYLYLIYTQDMIALGYVSASIYNNYSFHIPLRDDYTENHFRKDILENCKRCINQAEQTLIFDKQEYKEAESLEQEYNNEVEQRAIDFLDENNIVDKDIREAFIEAYKEKCSGIKYTNDVLKKFKYTILTNDYIKLITLLTDDEKQYQEIKEKCSLNKREISKLKEEMKNINLEEMYATL